MDLFLFANFFPYRKAEPFLVNEIKYAKQNSSTVTLFTLYGRPAEITADITGLKLLSPVLKDASDKKQLFFKGIFNFSPCSIHTREFFGKKIFLSPKKVYWFFVSLLMTRTVLGSPAYKQLISEVQKSKAPLLYFYWGDNLVWIIPYLVKQIPHVKIVMRLHGSDLYEHLRADYAPLREKIFANVSAIFTVSQTGCDYLKRRYPSFASKISVSRLGVEDHGLGEPPSAFTVVSVSNLVPLKRVDMIFDALQLLEVPVIWHHFGDGPLHSQLQELIKTHRKDLTVHFHGFVPNSEIIQFYQSTPVSLFVNVSTTEGVPVSVMESFSFGIPVLATRAGGTGELVNEQAGILLNVDTSAAEVSSAITKFSRMSTLEQEKMRTGARERYEAMASAPINYPAFYKTILQIANESLS